MPVIIGPVMFSKVIMVELWKWHILTPFQRVNEFMDETFIFPHIFIKILAM